MAKNIHHSIKPLHLRASVLAVASSLALCAAPMAANAAGLGKIVVFSALGQPLRAEIEVTATREELSGMRAQLASREAFKQAGLDYASTLSGIAFALDKRPDGQLVIKLTSKTPVNDPFVDMLMELNWPTGRLVREYTFLLDPPEVAAKNAQPVVAPATAAVRSGALAPTAPRPSSIGDDTRVRAQAQTREEKQATVVEAAAPAMPKAAEKPVEKVSSDGDFHEVKRGDTLSKIAGATKPEGVTLDQMLVGLLRANQGAFDGGNMNRLKSGKILAIPDRAALESVTPTEAKKVVMAQSADWNAYRGKLAAIATKAPVSEGLSSQESGGKITAKVEDKIEPAGQPKDRVKVSKSESGGAKAGVPGKPADEDVIAREKSLKEANERAAALEKNVANLQKLLELKEKNLAELQKQASAKPQAAEPAKPAAPVVPVKPEEAPKPVEPPKSAEPVKPVEPPKAVEPPKVVEPPKPVEPISAPPVVAAPPAPLPVEQKPVEPKPTVKADDMPKPKPKPVAPPPPPPEPSFFEELLDNPLMLAGGGGILALLGGYLVLRRRRASKDEVPLEMTSALSTTNNLTANSVFRSTGGQSVDTSHTPPQTDFSQAGPGTIDTDEVDPVAEADVYMAYGRDAQAEEILLEAKQKDAKRYAIHLKLLEIYANRKDLRQYEILSSELFGETSGVGADWEKAAAMGLKLDPANPLYGGSPQAGDGAAPSFDADATVIVPSQTMRNTVTLPGELSQLADGAEKEAAAPAPLDLASLDFDLGLDEAKPAAVPEAADRANEATLSVEPAGEPAPLDFDLAMPEPVANVQPAMADSDGAKDFSLPDLSLDVAASPVATPDVPDLDFDLGFSADAPVATAPETVKPMIESSLPTGGLTLETEASAANADGDLEFDVSLTESTFLGRHQEPESDLMVEPAEAASPTFDLNTIDLDLDQAAPKVSTEKPEVSMPDVAQSVETSVFDTTQVTTSVNADFLTAQAETVVNPQFGMETELAAPDFELNANEEVATKLDLAKAYEEMGDLEGARELLQEVVKEGDTGQREKAQALLAKIGA